MKKNNNFISKKLKIKAPMSEYTREEQRLLSKIDFIERKYRIERMERRTEKVNKAAIWISLVALIVVLLKLILTQC